MIWSCPLAQDVWGCGPRIFQKGCNTRVNFTRWFEEMMGRCSLEELELLAVVAQRIWLRINATVHEGVFTHPNQIIRKALTLVDDFRRNNAPEQKEPTSLTDPPSVLWQPPSLGKIKLNRGAAVNKKLGRIGIGIVARDNNGCFMAQPEAPPKELM